MRFANVQNRAVVLIEGAAIDIERASGGRFGPEPQSVLESWSDFRTWADERDLAASESTGISAEQLDPPSPRPSQVFAIGVNYADHATESELELPENPLVFTKFSSSLIGALADVTLPSDTVDWEVELVVVIGLPGRDIAQADAWDHVAGIAVGQDLSERTSQWWGSPAQFSLGKSYAGFAPVGPAFVTIDELRSRGFDPDDLALGCDLVRPDGTRETLQSGRTSDLIFNVPDLLARLSHIVRLQPGDLIFTGTPAGVGVGRSPKRFLAPGDELISFVEGVGEIHQRFSSAGGTTEVTG